MIVNRGGCIYDRQQKGIRIHFWKENQYEDLLGLRYHLTEEKKDSLLRSITVQESIKVSEVYPRNKISTEGKETKATQGYKISCHACCNQYEAAVTASGIKSVRIA